MGGFGQSVTKIGSTLLPLAGDATAPRSKALAVIETCEIGIWEIGPGIEHDIEVDEVFVVLTGSATITVEGSSPVEIGPGDVVHLEEGAETTWEVHQALRKLYVTAVDE